MFVELVPLLQDRTLLITVASISGKLKVNVIPAKANESEATGSDYVFSSFTGSAEELDAELGSHVASYVQSHLELRKTGRGEGRDGCGSQGRAPEGEDTAADGEIRSTY